MPEVVDSAIEVAQRRLASLGLASGKLETFQDVVRWLGAVQAQDVAGGKWSIGRRAPVVERELNAALQTGALLRTHVLRPTWHFVLPGDIRWLSRLSGPRVQKQNAYMYRQLGLGAAELHESQLIIAKELEGGKQRTRRQLGQLLGLSGQALGYVLMNAELEGLICSGSRDTYALLEERVPPVTALTREEALGELTWRYFASHGPAAVADFTWWCSLSAADAKLGLELCGDRLAHEEINGITYWFSQRQQATEQDVLLLQGYDEYFVGYSGQTKWVLDVSRAARTHADRTGVFTHVVVAGTQVVGRWRRTRDMVEAQLFGEVDRAALEAAVADYGRFLETEIRCSS